MAPGKLRTRDHLRRRIYNRGIDVRLLLAGMMPEGPRKMQVAKTGFEIRVNGTPRTFRDRKDMAYDAARLLKTKNPRAIIEIVDCSTGLKSVMLEDGRLA